MGAETIIGSVISTAGSLIGGSMAADAQGDAAQAAMNAQLLATQRARRQLRPYAATGRAATNQLATLLGLPTGNREGRNFGAERGGFDYGTFENDPGYAFRLSEGLKALEAGAAARGGLLSGNTLRATQDYAQNMASQEYTNAFNRFYAERRARLDPLFRLSGQGAGVATTMAGNELGYGQAAANNAYNMGNVQAAQYGQMAQGISNFGNMISQIPAYEQQSALNNALIRYYGG